MTGRAPTKHAAIHRTGSFDALELALRHLELAGTATASEFPRVADQLAPDVSGGDVGSLAWRICGMADALGRPALEVSLDGSVMLECQRCLRPFAWPVAQRTMLLLARDEREQARLDEDDEHEVIVAGAPLDPRELVEDELVLTLPFAPHCERGDCVTAGLPNEGDTGSKTAGKSPFDALAALKTGRAGKPKA